MDDVKVHYNSAQPAQLNALAYAQGTDIHVAPGQEKHLPHEAWHVAQQKQGRVKPTIQMKTGVPGNDDPGLEQEADVMGAKAAQTIQMYSAAQIFRKSGMSFSGSKAPLQRLTPAEKFAATNKSPEDERWALIGSDNVGESLVAVELIEATRLGMPLPSYLAGFIKKKGIPWTPEVNDIWMGLMVQQGRIFVVQHEEITEYLNAKRPDLVLEDKRVKRNGTWKEAARLLKLDYVWYKGLLIPPGLSKRYIADAEEQMRQAALSSATAPAPSPSASSSSAAAAPSPSPSSSSSAVTSVAHAKK